MSRLIDESYLHPGMIDSLQHFASTGAAVAKRAWAFDCRISLYCDGAQGQACFYSSDSR